MKAEDIKLAIEHGDINVISERLANIINEGNEELKKRLELNGVLISLLATHNAIEQARKKLDDKFNPIYFELDENNKFIAKSEI